MRISYKINLVRKLTVSNQNNKFSATLTAICVSRGGKFIIFCILSFIGGLPAMKREETNQSSNDQNMKINTGSQFQWFSCVSVGCNWL